ncbi:MAG: cyclic nucleotide-binding and patatin-like phospholipase domain-containing protein [Myxococcota bacterium]
MDRAVQSFLRTRPLFAGAAPDHLGRLVETTQRVRLSAGEFLFHEEDPPNSVFVVEDGLLEVLHERLGTAERLHVADVRRGAVLGELGVMRGDARTASVRAVEPSTLVSVPGRDFIAFVRSTPSAALRLAEILAHRTVPSPMGSGGGRPTGEVWAVERTDDLDAAFAAALARAAWRPRAGGAPPTVWCAAGARARLGKAHGLPFEPLQDGLRPPPGTVAIVLGALDALRALGPTVTGWVTGAQAVLGDEVPDSRHVKLTRHGGLGPRTVRFSSIRLHETAERVVRILEGRSVGLALGGGGALGLCHLGVLEVLERERVPIDFVAGTSAGALMAGLFLVRGLADSIERTEAMTRAQLFRLMEPSFFFSGRIAGRRIHRMFSDILGNATLEGLPVSFAALALDLRTGEERALTEGSLADALRATVSLASVFVPFRSEGEEGDLPSGVYIDAGGVNNVPVDVARELGAHRTIGVNVINRPKPLAPEDSAPWRSWWPMSRGKMIAHAELIGFARNGERQVFSADVPILPDTHEFGFTQFYRARELIELGRAAAKDLIEPLRALRGLEG